MKHAELGLDQRNDAHIAWSACDGLSQRRSWPEWRGGEVYVRARERMPVIPPSAGDVSLDEKVAFLSRATSYAFPAWPVTRLETHMSWVFLAGDEVFKLKKPLQFPYLNFSTLARREAACRAELALNHQLASDVYKAVVPIRRCSHGLTIGKGGDVVDWLVVMRRLDWRQTLACALKKGRVATWQLDRLVSTLAQFYRHAGAIFVSGETHLHGWQRSLAYNRSILLDPRLRLPAGLVRRVDGAQRRFLAERSALIADRVRRRQIVDGHGDLRAEHIWLGDPVRIIDRLEFNRDLRAVDPFDEIAFLCVECERLGCAWAGEYIKRRARVTLSGGLSDELFTFYRCHRATLRARLTIAHLLEPNARTPEKWPQLAITYLRLAADDARRLHRMLRTP
jgi:aminoglycoside phosphotransferase family enzyme